MQALAERRDAIGRAYLTAVNPIADPALDADWRPDVPERGGGCGLRDRARRLPRRLVDVRQHHRRERINRRDFGLQSPSRASAGPFGLSGVFIKVELSAAGGPPSWQQPVRAYFRHRDGAWRLVGFERLPEG